MSHLDQLKEMYNPDYPYPHDHDYSKKITQDIVEPIYTSEADRRYGEDPFTAHRWQGKLRKVGEKIYMVCIICDKTEDQINRLNGLWKELKSNKNPLEGLIEK